MLVKELVLKQCMPDQGFSDMSEPYIQNTDSTELKMSENKWQPPKLCNVPVNLTGRFGLGRESGNTGRGKLTLLEGEL